MKQKLRAFQLRKKMKRNKKKRNKFLNQRKLIFLQLKYFLL